MSQPSSHERQSVGELTLKQTIQACENTKDIRNLLTLITEQHLTDGLQAISIQMEQALQSLIKLKKIYDFAIDSVNASQIIVTVKFHNDENYNLIPIIINV